MPVVQCRLMPLTCFLSHATANASCSVSSSNALQGSHSTGTAHTFLLYLLQPARQASSAARYTLSQLSSCHIVLVNHTIMACSSQVTPASQK
jgi:hypothetical protein